MLRRALSASKREQEARLQRWGSEFGEKRTLLLMLDAQLKLLTRDLDAQLGEGLTPTAIKGIALGRSLAPTLADWAEARLSALLHQETRQQLMYCAPCRAQRTDLPLDDQGEVEGWRFKHGVSSPSELAELARELELGSLIDLSIAWSANANRLFLRARLFNRAGEEVWARDYQNDAQGEARRVALPGEPKGTSEDLYQRRAQQFGEVKEERQYELLLGWSNRPTTWAMVDGLPDRVNNIALGGGMGERFGELERYRYLLTLRTTFSLSLTTPSPFGFQLGGELLRRVNTLNPQQLTGSLNQGFWLGGGVALNYVDFVQGVGLELLAEWVSSIDLGARVELGYQLGFGLEASDPSGLYVSLLLLYLL